MFTSFLVAIAFLITILGLALGLEPLTNRMIDAAGILQKIIKTARLFAGFFIQAYRKTARATKSPTYEVAPSLQFNF